MIRLIKISFLFCTVILLGGYVLRSTQLDAAPTANTSVSIYDLSSLCVGDNDEFWLRSAPFVPIKQVAEVVRSERKEEDDKLKGKEPLVKGPWANCCSVETFDVDALTSSLDPNVCALYCAKHFSNITSDRLYLNFGVFRI